LAMKRALVTGGAGFIGSHLCEALIKSGYEVKVLDNLSSGKADNIAHLLNRGLSFTIADLKAAGSWAELLRDVDVVFHFAANPEVRVSNAEPRVHFEENLVATFNLLEAARHAGINCIVFASTSTVYGDAKVIPTPENHPIAPISVYGAVKAACEHLVSTYCALYGMSGVILRYANVIGSRGHGVIRDFIAKLRRNPHELEILGDGMQSKSYIHVKDAVEATLFALEHRPSKGRAEVYNVGSEDRLSVLEISRIVCEEMGFTDVKFILKPATPDGRGWPGDVKIMQLDVSKLESLGWRPKMNSREAVRRATRELLEEAGLR